MKKTNFLFTLLYIIGLLLTAYVLYQLPMHLVEAQIVDLVKLKQVQPIINQLYIVIGSTLALGAVTITVLWLTRETTTVLQSTTQGADSSQAYQGYEENSDESKGDALQIEGIREIIASEEDEETTFTKALSLICRHMEASQAIAYQVKSTEEYSYIEMLASFAYHAPEGEKTTYRFGEGLAGQVAKQGEQVVLDSVPEGYIEILSGLGKASPTHLIILPLKHEDQVVGVVEIASFKEFSSQQKADLPLVFNQLALKLSNNDNVSLEEATS